MSAVCEVTWGLWDGALVAEFAGPDEMGEFTDRADVEGWAQEHRLNAHPWAARVRVVRCPLPAHDGSTIAAGRDLRRRDIDLIPDLMPQVDKSEVEALE